MERKKQFVSWPKAKYMVRLSDYAILSLNEDGETYSMDDQKRQFPNNIHAMWTEDMLSPYHFMKITENQVGAYRRLHDEHYAELVKNKTTDGHGDEEE